MEADEITRKRRQAEFWVWYIKEAARLCDDPIKERIKVESFIPDPPMPAIKNAQDFVRAISSELDYIKHEKMDEEKKLVIHVCKHKNGEVCPKCSMFSDHIRMSLPVRDELRKFKGWKVELKNRLDFYYCDNESCSEEYFPARIQVGLTEKRSNFLYITKQKENEKIIYDLFGLS